MQTVIKEKQIKSTIAECIYYENQHKQAELCMAQWELAGWYFVNNILF